ncbi:HET-domain-containing protein [Hyaloscypha variabilis F]|uniref:HET-domain-containing protein n=1 Tax=Hyaloscypha variabilis (strain UAMH 11265 / GT02V1 / F) TaxID=1149755 RepID=A0A2J6REP4_HYAVF|nr:HET-domain-containing protein [Hyaloscypha variabilis F]
MTPSGIYTILTYAKTNIRLVVLSPGQGNETIQCHLRIVRLSRAGRYEALSYEWGSLNDDTSLIILNGKLFRVQKNLSRALKALRSESVEQTFWIDALCINQEDKTEKNHQVPLMGDIYRGAHLVRV